MRLRPTCSRTTRPVLVMCSTAPGVLGRSPATTMEVADCPTWSLTSCSSCSRSSGSPAAASSSSIRAGQVSSSTLPVRAVDTSVSWRFARSTVVTAAARISAVAGGPGRTGRVVADPLVHGDGFLGHADAVDLHAARPRVDGQLRGEVAGEVAAVGGVAADGERGELLAVEQPGLPGVAHADGGQERVGRLDVAGVGAELVDGGVRADVPVGLVGAAHPGRRDGGRRAQVQRELAVARARRPRAAASWCPARRRRPRGGAAPRRRTPRWPPRRHRSRSGSSRPARAREAGRRSRGRAAGSGSRRAGGTAGP